MNVNMECPKCQYVGQYTLDEKETANLVLIKFVCGNCGLMDKGLAFKQVEKQPRTLKQILRTAKGIVKELGRLYAEDARDFRYSVEAEPSLLISYAGYAVGIGMFLYHVVPIITGAMLDPEYVAGRTELYNLLIGFVSLGFGIFMLRRRWDF